MQSDEALAAKLAALLPHLDERQRRLVLGAEARALGHGGITAVARATGISTVTVSRGLAELDRGGEPLGRARRPGGGRKPVTATNPGLWPALLALLEPVELDDPPLRWTTNSTRQLARALDRVGHTVSAPTVAKLLRAERFSLQGKPTEGRQLRDRDAQFRYVLDRAVEHLGSGDPVIGVESRKKDLFGPCGVDDADSAGWVDAGSGDDIAHFAVATIRAWWHRKGRAVYPRARRLLITVSGGGNGTRALRWKLELAKLASETGMPLTVCHLPLGTSKWTCVVHRAISRICLSADGAPVSYEVILRAISPTTTRTELAIEARLGVAGRPTGLEITNEHITDLERHVVRRHEFNGEWNYELTPNAF